MEIIGIMALLLSVGVIALSLRIAFRGKNGKGGKSNIRIPEDPILMRMPRYRDGAVTYKQVEGIRGRQRLENPYQPHTARYERRHRSRKHTPNKPWEQ